MVSQKWYMIARINKTSIAVFLCTLLLLFSAVYFLRPQVKGDSITYLQAMDFLRSGVVVHDFVPNRILTNFGALYLIIFLAKIFGSINIVWIAINIVFCAVSALVFYSILKRILGNEQVAMVGTLFLVGNYAFITFGPAFLMDIGGWMFYLISILYTLRYSDTRDRGDILLASFAVGVGALFKEYALLGVVPIGIYLIYENKNSIIILIKKSLLPAITALLPILSVFIYAYLKFDYTYMDWLGSNRQTYVYSSRLVEYIKSFGSLLNILSILFMGGLVVLYKRWGDLGQNIKIFVISIFASILPIMFWPAITQRILFIMVPFVIIITSFFIERYKDKYYLFIPALSIYILISFLMDGFILNKINLPF